MQRWAAKLSFLAFGCTVFVTVQCLLVLGFSKTLEVIAMVKVCILIPSHIWVACILS